MLMARAWHPRLAERNSQPPKVAPGRHGLTDPWLPGELRAVRPSYFGPTTEQRYSSPVTVRVISPAAAAARTSLSDVSWRGVWPAVNAICTSSHNGLKPSP